MREEERQLSEALFSMYGGRGLTEAWRKNKWWMLGTVLIVVWIVWKQDYAFAALMLLAEVFLFSAQMYREALRYAAAVQAREAAGAYEVKEES
jgi:hypothetical protein